MYSIPKVYHEVLKNASSILLKNDKLRYAYSYLYVSESGEIISTNGHICFIIKNIDVKNLGIQPGYYLFKKIDDYKLIPVSDHSINEKPYINHNIMLNEAKEFVISDFYIDNSTDNYSSRSFINLSDLFSTEDELFYMNFKLFSLFPSGSYNLKISRSDYRIYMLVLENKDITIAVAPLSYR